MSKQTAAKKTNKSANQRPSIPWRISPPTLFTPAGSWRKGHAPQPTNGAGGELTLLVTIPAEAVTMFRACVELYEISPKALGRRAVLEFIKSENVLTRMDQVLAGIPD